MTIEEIFGKLIQNAIKGLMVHEQMTDYYDFLSLHGYKRCHEYHCVKEAWNYRKINRFYINHFNKLIIEMPVENPHMIPTSWYKYTRQEVDTQTKRSAVKSGIVAWKEWEEATKKLYEELYKEACNLNEVKAAEFIKEMICDVSCELKKIYRYHLNLKAVDYSIEYIISSQDKKHKKYKEKMEKFRLCTR